MSRDEALERFDRLRVREVRADHTASTFQAQFHSTAASLEPDERIKLLVYTHESMESLKAVLADPEANKICSFFWAYNEKEDVNSVVPLLLNNCPELASLEVYFDKHSAFDFVSSVLEHPSNKVKVLKMPGYPEGDSARFFAALGQSQVSALTLSLSPKSVQGLCEYLAKDVLVRFGVGMHDKQVPSEMMMSLADCACLTELDLARCEFSQSTALTHLPKSITKLELSFCKFSGGADWSFLAGSNLRELDFLSVSSVDGNQFGGVLAVHLRAKGLDRLHFAYCGFVNETLAVLGVGLGRIKRFEGNSHLNAASIKLIALALQSPNNEMKELVLEYTSPTMSGIEYHLVPALKHPNCNLVKLLLWAYDEHEEAARRVTYTFHSRLALFVLLQGRQVRRRSPCPLRRLPVEMFRLVGAALI